MPASIIATGAIAVTSADVVVAAGTPVTVAVRPMTGGKAPEGTFVRIELKDEAGAYHTHGELNTDVPAVVLNGPGTYRFVRLAGPTFGVFSG